MDSRSIVEMEMSDVCGAGGGFVLRFEGAMRFSETDQPAVTRFCGVMRHIQARAPTTASSGGILGVKICKTVVF